MARRYMHGTLSKPSRKRYLTNQRTFGRQLDKSKEFQALLDHTIRLTNVVEKIFTPPAQEKQEVRSFQIGFTMKGE